MGTIYIGRYKVIEELGRGGMGVVYRGEDPVLERQVAIKVLPPKKMTPKSIERFLREAKTAARLDSPYIVKIHDIGQVDDIHFIVMEYVEGSSLGDMIDYEEVPTAEQLRLRLKIFRQVMEAVRYAHENGVIHRDLKPDNIMVNKSGHVKVMDFGLAFFAGQHSLTEVGQVMGTAAYVSPEQAVGKLTDERTDIYSLGVILFELITGRWPFSAGNPLEMFRKVAEEPAPSPRIYNKSISPGLETLVLRSLRKKVDDRFSSVADMIESFDMCLRSESFASSAAAPAVSPSIGKLPGTKTHSRLPAPSSARFNASKAGVAPEVNHQAPPLSEGGSRRLPDPSSIRRLPIGQSHISETMQAAAPVNIPAPVSAPASPLQERRSSAPVSSSSRLVRSAHTRPAVVINSAAAYEADVARQQEQAAQANRRAGVVITIGGEEAFRTSVASYSSQDQQSSVSTEESVIKPDAFPQKVSLPTPGPPVRRVIQETSVAAPLNLPTPGSASPAASSGTVQIPIPKIEPAPRAPEPKTELPKPSAVPESSEESGGAAHRRFVGGSGSAVASNAWMAGVEEKSSAAPSEAAPIPNSMAAEAPSERDVETVIKSGLAALKDSRFQEAASEFNLVLARDPENVQGLIGLGRVRCELGEYGSSRSLIEESIRVAPDSHEPYVALADFFSRTDQPALVISALHKALDRCEYDNILRCRLAFLYFSQNRPDVAFEQYCVALEQAPDDFLVNYQFALFLSTQERYSEALNCLHRACSAQPSNGDIYTFLADVCLKLGDTAQAQSVLEGAIEAGVRIDAGVHTDWASLYMAQNNEKQAVSELSEALEAEPGHIEASIKLSALFCHHNQLSEAARTLEQALKFHPNSLSLHRRLGEVFILGGSLEKAMDHFEQIVKLEPACAENYNRLGRIYLKKHYDASSVEQYQKAVESHPVNPSYREDLAMVYYCMGKYQAAIAELVKACRLDYTNPDYPKALGIMLLELGAYEDAMRQLQSSLSLRPNDAQARGMLGRALAGQGLNNLAIIEFQKAIDADPDMYLFNLPLARAYAMQGRHDQAVLCFKRFLNVIPDSSGFSSVYNAYVGVGRSLIASGEFACALEVLSSILVRDPYNAGAHIGLAKVWLSKKNYTKASGCVEEGLKSAPRYAPLLLVKAEVLGAQDRWSSAVSVLLEAAQEAPHNHRIVEQLGRAYRKCGRLQDAVEVFSKAAEDFPELSSHFYWLKGRVLYRQGQYEASVWAYRQAIEVAPEDWRVYLDMGKAYSSLQQLDEAAGAYRSAERLAPAEEKKQIRSMLSRLRR
ncbi:MAG: tetratricopeptide repeat protein [Candidatus Bruticola sp.]